LPNYSNFVMSRADFLLIFFCLLCSSALGQQMEVLVDRSYNGLDWTGFVKQVEQTHPTRFFYQEADIGEFQVPLLAAEVPLLDFLQDQLPHCHIAQDRWGHIFISKETEINTQLSKAIYPEVMVAG
jgi:hypothetical protein